MMTPRKRAYTFWFWAGVGVILALNVTLWLFVNQVEKRFSQELKARLAVSSHAVVRLLDSDDIRLITPGDTGTTAYLSLLLHLQSVRAQDSLQTVILYGLDGAALVSAPEALGRDYRIVADSLFNKARQGAFVVEEPRRFSGMWFMAALAPVPDEDGFPIAVVRIEARARFFKTLETLRNRLFWFSLINFVVIGVIAFFLFRMIDRAIHYQLALNNAAHLAELGTMAATVAHELRNPLGIISGTNDLIRKKYGKENDPLFTFIPDEIRRLNALITNFLQFARTPDLQVAECDLKTWLDRLKVGLPDERRALLTVQGLENIPTWPCDARILEQVLLNILNNAFEAFEDETGRVDVRFRVRRNRLYIEVCDNGPGMDETTREKVLQPFFTTKETGTGLGLAISHHLMRVMNGAIHINSNPGKGTCVTLEVPRLKSKE